MFDIGFVYFVIERYKYFIARGYDRLGWFWADRTATQYDRLLTWYCGLSVSEEVNHLFGSGNMAHSS